MLFDALPFENITSTSTIPLSMQAYDDDGAIESVQFYINGLPYGDKVFRPTGLTDDDFILSIKVESRSKWHLYSIHGIATDNSGNSVATTVITVTATTGTNYQMLKLPTHLIPLLQDLLKMRMWIELADLNVLVK